jgi:hypothetical protein
LFQTIQHDSSLFAAAWGQAVDSSFQKGVKEDAKQVLAAGAAKAGPGWAGGEPWPLYGLFYREKGFRQKAHGFLPESR